MQGGGEDREVLGQLENFAAKKDKQEVATPKMNIWSKTNAHSTPHSADAYGDHNLSDSEEDEDEDEDGEKDPKLVDLDSKEARELSEKLE